MTPPGDIGTVKRVLRDVILGPDMARILQAVEARFADGIPLPQPDAEAVYTSAVARLDAYPAVELEGLRSAPVGDMQDDMEAPVDHIRHEIAVQWWVHGDDEERLTKQVERYVLATRRLLRGSVLHPAVGSMPVANGTEEYLLVQTRDQGDSPFLKGGVLTVYVETVDDGPAEA